MKKQLIYNIQQYLNKELDTLLQAANNAHLAAIDDQSIAETQYDTLAIEAGYLAEGQSRRVEELRNAITLFEQLESRLNSAQLQKLSVQQGSIVQLAEDESSACYFFIGPAAAGFRCEIEGKFFTIVTPESPMGNSLLNKEVGDEVSFNNINNTFIDEIIYIE